MVSLRGEAPSCWRETSSPFSSASFLDRRSLTLLKWKDKGHKKEVMRGRRWALWSRVYLFHVQEVYLRCLKVPKEGDLSSCPCEEPQRVPSHHPVHSLALSWGPQLPGAGLAGISQTWKGCKVKESWDEALRPDANPRSQSWWTGHQAQPTFCCWAAGLACGPGEPIRPWNWALVQVEVSRSGGREGGIGRMRGGRSLQQPPSSPRAAPRAACPWAHPALLFPVWPSRLW